MPTDDSNLLTNDSSLQTNAPVIQSNPNQSESEYNPYFCAEPDKSASTPEEAAICLELNDGSDYPIYRDQIDEWGKLCPALDIMQQRRSMKGWLESDPARHNAYFLRLRYALELIAQDTESIHGCNLLLR